MVFGSFIVNDELRLILVIVMFFLREDNRLLRGDVIEFGKVLIKG